MPISLNSFSGVAPSVPARYLADNQAQTALNCANWQGPLAPLRDMVNDHGGYFAEDYAAEDYNLVPDGETLSGVAANSLYLFGSLIGIRR